MTRIKRNGRFCTDHTDYTEQTLQTLKLFKLQTLLMPHLLNISIVLYHTPAEEWQSLVQELLRSACVHRIYLVDNSPEPISAELVRPLTAAAHQSAERVQVMATGKNLGYGAAHNKAIRETIYDDLPYHLVINSDIQVTAEAIDHLLSVMQANPLIGQLLPRVVDCEGREQYVCKLLPTPMDLIRRVVLGRHIESSARNARFELRQLDHSKPINAPYLSGCFMLLRTEALLKAGLFDERFFMYPEDIDLTRRIHRDYLTLYYPSETIVHAHRKASYHSPRMFVIHAANIVRYFCKWGWLFDTERRQMNLTTLPTLL